jgi:hypothetical protein
MHDIFSREPDPLDDMLRPPSMPPESEALQQMVYSRTRRVLRHRRLMRQFAYFAVMLHAFVGGMGTMYAIMRPAPAPDKPTPSASEEAPQPPVPAPDEPALVKEWKAFDSDDRRGELYLQAGDRYLEEENDLSSALRCYSNALDNGTKQDLTISTDDNWLLMAIKDARQKENNHAKTDG